eukprot:CAMPEP_0173273112 /NCGR_PEP_ID=MMETSP1143-20121109/1726_1 /TAXON_ID=483371 /ORGANISM="non described non described, Strain CCMP2298" /LENGTH=44 /DNA_ID= /DNA_START= /DNA_END= /DNA_ORIENTATION=
MKKGTLLNRFTCASHAPMYEHAMSLLYFSFNSAETLFSSVLLRA